MANTPINKFISSMSRRQEDLPDHHNLSLLEYPPPFKDFTSRLVAIGENMSTVGQISSACG